MCYHTDRHDIFQTYSQHRLDGLSGCFHACVLNKITNLPLSLVPLPPLVTFLFPSSFSSRLRNLDFLVVDKSNLKEDIFIMERQFYKTDDHGEEDTMIGLLGSSQECHFFTSQQK